MKFMTTVAVIEKPILFSAPMIRRILDGSKTMTRRAVKVPVIDRNSTGCELAGCELNGMLREGRFDICPYGAPGDHLWVKETYRTIHDPATCIGDALDIDYRADGQERIMDRFKTPGRVKWKPAIFMPRWASRITLEITDVRVQRVQEISADDAIGEGIPPEPHLCDCTVCAHTPQMCPATQSSLIMAYAELWDSINKKRGFGWEINPWVWAYTFKRIKP